MKSDAKCRNGCSLVRLGVTQGNRQCYYSIERIRLVSKVADFQLTQSASGAFVLVGVDSGRISRRPLVSEN